MQKTFTIKSLDELENLSSEIQALILEAKQNYTNQIFFLKAQMGSGKTTFIRSLVKKFNSDLRVTSPTFIGMHLYEDDEFDFYHYDLYQVAINIEEFMDILDNPKNKVILFEWSENLSEAIAESIKNTDSKLNSIDIEALENEDRVFTLKT